MKTLLKKITVVAAAVAVSFLAACQKDQSPNASQKQAPTLVNYTVADRMQVNNEDGKPRAIGSLPAIDQETVALSDRQINGQPITLKNTAGANLLLDVVGNSGGKLTLAQTYAATNGMASGTIYYTLNKN